MRSLWFYIFPSGDNDDFVDDVIDGLKNADFEIHLDALIESVIKFHINNLLDN